MQQFDAVVVAGGQGSRMGYVSKADLDVSGERLLDIGGTARHLFAEVHCRVLAVPDLRGKAQGKRGRLAETH